MIAYMSCWVYSRVRSLQRVARTSPTVICLGLLGLRSRSQVIQTGLRARFHVRPHARASSSSRGWVAAYWIRESWGPGPRYHSLPPQGVRFEPGRWRHASLGTEEGTRQVACRCSAVRSHVLGWKGRHKQRAYTSPRSPLGLAGFSALFLSLVRRGASSVCCHARVHPQDLLDGGHSQGQREIGAIGTRRSWHLLRGTKEKGRVVHITTGAYPALRSPGCVSRVTVHRCTFGMRLPPPSLFQVPDTVCHPPHHSDTYMLSDHMSPTSCEMARRFVVPHAYLWMTGNNGIAHSEACSRLERIGIERDFLEREGSATPRRGEA